MSIATRKFKLVFFAPKDSTRRILDHLFAKFPQHVGKIGAYEQCAFVSRGTVSLHYPTYGYYMPSLRVLNSLPGQFKPGSEASPAVGMPGQLEHVEEDRVEVLVVDQGHNEEVKSAVRELKNVHPYEEVAYDVYRLEDF